MVFGSGILRGIALKEKKKPTTTTAGIAQVGCEDLIQCTLTFQLQFDSLTETRRKRSKHVAILDSATVQDGYVL